MKITAVLGSPSKNGNTCVLAREVLRGAHEAGAEVDEIFLAGHKIEYCRGCMACMATGRCVIDDEANALRERLYASDGLVLASPAYGREPTARMKNFLVDRIGMFTAYTSHLGGKYFVGVSTCGGVGGDQTARQIAADFVVGFHQRAYLTGALGVSRGYERIEDRPADLAKAYRLGQKLVDDIRVRRRYPFQSLLARLVMALVVRPIILRNIYANKAGRLKAVYADLVDRGFNPRLKGNVDSG